VADGRTLYIIAKARKPGDKVTLITPRGVERCNDVDHAVDYANQLARLAGFPAVEEDG